MDKPKENDEISNMMKDSTENIDNLENNKINTALRINNEKT